MQQHEQSIKQELSQHNPRKVPFIPSLFEKQTLSLFASPIKCPAFAERLGRLESWLHRAECEGTSPRLPQPHKQHLAGAIWSSPSPCSSRVPLWAASSGVWLQASHLYSVSRHHPHLFWSPAVTYSTQRLSWCIGSWLGHICTQLVSRWGPAWYYHPGEKESRGGFLIKQWSIMITQSIISVPSSMHWTCLWALCCCSFFGESSWSRSYVSGWLP